MNAFRIIYAILREIFEESAYERFCKSEGLAPGQGSYALFLRHRRVGVRCC